MFRRDKPRELTGRHVLLWLVGFFGFIFVVNGVMIHAATSTFGGLETQSSYKAGLRFKSEVARAARQQALGWQVIAPLCLGSLILGIPVALIGYALTLRFIPTLRRWRIPRWPRRRKDDN